MNIKLYTLKQPRWQHKHHLNGRPLYQGRPRVEDKEDLECLTSVSVGLYSWLPRLCVLVQVQVQVSYFVSCPAPGGSTKSSINFYKPHPPGPSSAF